MTLYIDNEIYNGIKSIRYEYQPHNGKDGSMWLFIKSTLSQFSIQITRNTKIEIVN